MPSDVALLCWSLPPCREVADYAVYRRANLSAVPVDISWSTPVRVRPGTWRAGRGLPQRPNKISAYDCVKYLQMCTIL